MTPWWRLAQLAWPYRRQLAGSVLFGLGAAALWGLELLLTFPLVTVFVEGKTLDGYLHEQAAAVEVRLQELHRSVDHVVAELDRLDDRNDPEAIQARTGLLQDQARGQRRLNQESWRLWLIGWTQSNVIPWLPENQFQLLVALLIGLIIVTVAKGACTYLQDIWSGAIAERCVIDLRTQMFRRLLARDPQSVELAGPAKLLSGLTFELQGLAHGLTTIGGRVVREPLKAGACILAGFVVNWRLTALALIVVPIAGWLFSYLGKRMKRGVHRMLDAMAVMYKFLEETFHNARIVLAYQQQSRVRREFLQKNSQFYRQSMRLVQIEALTNPLTEFLGMSAILLGVLPGGYLLLRNTTSIGFLQLASEPITVAELVTLYALLAGVLDPLRKFSKYFAFIKQAGTALERAYKMLDQATLAPHPVHPVELPERFGELEFRDVHFEYATRDGSAAGRTPVLHGVSFTVQAGEMIAIVGPNGSGKSTLLGLLSRFFDPSAGAVLIDGIDLRDVAPRTLRGRTAIVPQEPILLDDTIVANIRYGCPDAAPAVLQNAAEQASVLEFAKNLTHGLETAVGPQGRALSGGQRQRIALARAMVRDPELLILDEPTAAVDALSEQLVQRALREFVKGRTTFLITHQLSAAWLEMISRVVVLDQGRVVAIGRHDELLKVCPIYQRLFAQGAVRHAA